MREYSYRDTWGGKNYGCYAISTPGQNLKDRLDRSEKWLQKSKNDYIDERNDNQVDIHRGSDFVYVSACGGKEINIYMNRSRSGKTIDWKFCCNFYEPITF